MTIMLVELVALAVLPGPVGLRSFNSADDAQTSLAEFAERIDRPVVFQMPVLDKVYWPILGQVEPTMLGMSAVAMEGGYRWHQIKGVQVFIQRPIFNRSGGLPASEDVLSLAKSMTASMRSSLVNEGVLFDELTSYQMDFLAPIWKGHRGLGRQILMRSGDSRVKIRFMPSITYVNEQGRKLILPLRNDVEGGAYAPEPSTGLAGMNTLERFSRGALDFGSGKTMKMIDIVVQAARAFGVHYSIDPRIANLEMFVSGSMNQAVWEEVLPVITDTKPGKRSYDSSGTTGGVVEQITALLLELAENPDELLAMHMNGGQISASELQAMIPSLEARFKQLKIAPNASLKLSYGVSLEVQAPGYRLVKMPDGSEQFYSNSTSFFFPRG